MTEFDDLYGEKRDYFGSKRSSLIDRHITELEPGTRVLDVGIGQGRNTLEMARRGVHVTGIDNSRKAIRDLEARARLENLPLSLWCGDFMDFEPADLPHLPLRFDVVMVFGLLQLLPRSLGASLIFRLRRWTRMGGRLLLSAWHVDDPSYGEISRDWECIGLHSYRGPEGQVRTFLAREEILDLMLGWHLDDHREDIGPEHRHAEGATHRHGIVEVVATRTV